MAKQLGVKPEEVVEMETRLGGQDIALEPHSDDDEDSFAPISYLTNPDLNRAAFSSTTRRSGSAKRGWHVRWRVWTPGVGASSRRAG